MGQRVLIVGIARSGLAAVNILHKHGASISICDKKGPEEITVNADELRQMGVVVYLGYYPQVKRDEFDIIVLSPGVPLDISPVIEADAQGIPVIGEVELAYLLKGDTVEVYAVTGTNGKTTTTALLQHMMACDGRKSVCAGNIGVPLSSVVDRMSEGFIALEISSFQLETIRNFRPHIAAIINISPDHLDRHASMDSYINAKSRIFANQSRDDFAVLNYEDKMLKDLAENCKSEVCYFSTERVLQKGAYIEDNEIKVNINNSILAICALEEVLLRGKHNQENVLCAVSMAILSGVHPDNIRRALISFPGVRHRMEEVALKNGILYINDSKATNPESVMKALESFSEPLVLIAGGRNKGSDFSSLATIIANKVKALVLLGEARDELKTAVMKTGFNNIYEVGTFDSAVMKASELAAAGDVVLLSPACASWDMFESYEHRGDLFCKIVNQL